MSRQNSAITASPTVARAETPEDEGESRWRWLMVAGVALGQLLSRALTRRRPAPAIVVAI
jgi:hypothetical protein